MERESKRKSYRLVETRSVFGHCEVVRRMWLGGSLRLQSGAHAAKPCVYGEQGNPRFSAGSRAKRAHENRAISSSHLWQIEFVLGLRLGTKNHS